MPTDPLTASRYPAATNVPNVPQDIQNAVFDLADNTIPYFTSTAARDTAYANWVAAGGVMRNGLYCYVNGVGHQEYRVTSPTGWRSLTKQSGTVSAAITASDQRTGTVTFPFAFAAAPVVQLTALVPTGSSVDLTATLIGDPTATSFDYRLRDRGAPSTITVSSKLHWVATL